MPVLYQKFINRCDLTDNPDTMYLFGDNHLRVGMGGQAAHMRGEENAQGIRTKWKPDNKKSSFFSDKDFDEIIVMIEEDMQAAHEHLKMGLIVVIPTDGLGTGLSKLPELAPTVNEFLENELEQLTLIQKNRNLI